MLSSSLLRGLQAQIRKELESAYLYYSMANHFEAMALYGFAHWMRMQALEELGHADLFRAYVRWRHEAPELPSLKKPKSFWNGYRDPFEDALAHEKKISASIQKLYRNAKKDEDEASLHFLNIFIDEQKEEEKAAKEAVDKVSSATSSPELANIVREFGYRELPQPLPVDWDELAEQIQ